MDTKEIDIDALHEAMRARLMAAFPAVQTVAIDYARQGQRISTPAIFIELVQIETESDIGTEQLHANFRFEARCVVGALKDTSGIEVRKLAMAVAGYINLTRWGQKQPDSSEINPQPISPAHVIGCYPDSFDPELDQYDVWRVEWEQSCYIGQSVWTGIGVAPSEIRVSVNGGETEEILS